MANVEVEVRSLKEMLPLLAEFEQQMDAVERLAYHLFEQRGAQDGGALDDWLAAQHQILCLPQAWSSEDGDAFYVHTSLSGFQHRQLDVIVSPNDMIIRAKSSGPDGDLTAAEFRLKAMSHYRFPELVEPQTIGAEFDDGMLRVLIPKHQPSGAL